VTQYVDHEARARTQDARVASAFFGKGEAMKLKALEMAVAMADGSERFVTVDAPTSDSSDTDFSGLLGRPARI
jgi:hypothetical protein